MQMRLIKVNVHPPPQKRYKAVTGVVQKLKGTSLYFFYSYSKMLHISRAALLWQYSGDY